MENKRTWFDAEEYPTDTTYNEVFRELLSYWATNRNVIQGRVGILRLESSLSEEQKQERLSEILGALESFESLLNKTKRYMDNKQE